MGANCCVAARDKSLPNRNGHEASAYRNIRYSPSWSFRWDNRTHIEDIVENMVYCSHHNSGNATSEVKSAADTETDGLSDGESPPKVFPSSQWRKSYVVGGSDKSKFIAADQNTPGNSSPEGKSSLKSSVFPTASYMKSSITMPLSPPAVKVDYPSSSRNGFIPSDPTSTRKACRSPGYQLCRQISDSRIPSLKSLNEGSSPEVGRHSFVLSNELSAGESHGGSSDGWSMRTFSELVASSQRERWSFDSENFTSLNKIFGPTPTVLPKTSYSPDQQSCCICSKLLKDKSPWCTHKLVSTNDLPIVSVLVCSHVYHAECLESLTSEIEIYDPPCPVCANYGERPALKQFGKFELKGRNKISRIAVANADVPPRDSISNDHPIMGASSSTKSSFGKPFLKRHFSIGSRPIRSASENATTRKKGFWAKYRRE
ncbi:hypothetical protein M5K25_004618 [Dendrobium thyrsiflorum]|uniref:RING-type domain-containing protein n=1 Tax=Dendrobium thyrsiflorum TaxID=117978 RepID=A0ABD0VFD4_DENTH